MTKTSLYLQDPKYQVRLGGKADFIRDPSLVFDAPLYKLDGASFMSKDAYGHLCTVTGALWTPRGRDFDGVDDNIDCGGADSLKFNGLDTQTIEAWIYPEASEFGDIVGRMNCYLLMVVTSAGKVLLRGHVYTSGGTYVRDSAPFGLNTWHHVAQVYDGTDFRIYVNGSLACTPLDGTGTINQAAVNTYIGSRTPSSDFFNGLIGEVRMYNRVLSAVEIQRNYLATKWRYR